MASALLSAHTLQSFSSPSQLASSNHSQNPKCLSFHKHRPLPIAILDEPTSSSSYASLLDSCQCPHFAKQLHSHISRTGFCRDHFVQAKLLQMYARCGSLQEALVLFDKMPVRNLYAWTAILSAHVDSDLFEEALFLFLQWQIEDVGFEFFVLPVVFKICAGLWSEDLGRQVHGMAAKFGFLDNVYVGNALIDMYGKFGSLDDAKRIFGTMREKDRVTFNSIVTACASNGEVYEASEFLNAVALDESLRPNIVSWSAVLGGFSQNGYDEEAVEMLIRMQEAGFAPNERTLASILPSCARLKRLTLGKEIHGYVYRHGFLSSPYLVNGLIDVYRRCRNMASALAMFSNFSTRNAISCNAMIVGYCDNGEIARAKALFDQMEWMGVGRDLITWNAIISGHVGNGLFDEALCLLRESLEKGVVSDSFTLGSTLSACAETRSLRRGKEIHSRAVLTGLQSAPFVGGALVEMYCRCQDLSAAQRAFDEMTKKDAATWNALISGYARSDRIEEIPKILEKMREYGFEANVYTWNGIMAGYLENGRLELAVKSFAEMQSSNLQPDIFTIGIIVTVCARLSMGERGKQAQAHSVRFGYDAEVHVGAALVDMYAKCGSLKHALWAHNRIANPNLVSQNAMLNAYAIHGRGEEGIAFFRKMLEDGFRPDHTTFLSVLSLCVHVGSVETGHEIFNLMGCFDVKPTLKHYTCIVDLLSRSCKLNEAFEFARKMPIEGDSVLWGALLGGCVTHGNVELGEIAAKRLIELEPENAGNYVLLANLYARARKWNDLARIRLLMKDEGMHKTPGCSWIENGGGIHVFLASDESHSKSDEIYRTLNNLSVHMETSIHSSKFYSLNLYSK